MAAALPAHEHPAYHIRRHSSLSSVHRSSHRSSNSQGASRSISRSVSHRHASSNEAQSARASLRPEGQSQVQPPQIHTQPQTSAQVPKQTVRSRLKSQYPRNSLEPHVEYILLASFDIDRGPTMSHQYPGAISPDENMLAELMLPDQTHVRQQDWTMFFLHKDNHQDGQKQNDHDSDEEDDNKGPSLMYVLNLVYTKKDSSVKRGARTQAMAICTRHSFLHVYRPLLLLALEDYFNAPSQMVLQDLYDCLNNMDLSLMPRLTPIERQILQANDIKDLFIEKFESMIEQQNQELGDDTIPRRRLVPPRDTHEFPAIVSYHGKLIPLKIPTAPSPETVGDFSLIELIQKFNTPHSTSPQALPLHPHLTTAGPLTHPILVLINAILTSKRVIFLGHQLPAASVAQSVLASCSLASGNGVLKGFSLHAFPYTDLSKIDELLKVPGFVAGVTNPAFAMHPEWWDLLVDLSSGRITISKSIEPAPETEGTLHFKSHVQASSTNKNDNTDPAGDIAFMDDVLQAISQRQSENLIRNKFRTYIARFVRIAAAFEETVYGATSLLTLPHTEIDRNSKLVKQTSNTQKPSTRNGTIASSQTILKGHGHVWPTEQAKTRDLAALAAKIEGWRHTRSYQIFVNDLASSSTNKSRAQAVPASDDLSDPHTDNAAQTSPLSSNPGTPTSMTLSSRADKQMSLADMLAESPTTGTTPTSLRPSLSPAQSQHPFSRQPLRLKPSSSAQSTAVAYIDIPHHLSRLSSLRLTPNEAAQIYLALESYVHSHETILELLSHAPVSEAGLFHISLGLWHEDKRVRVAAERLLERIRQDEVGRLWFARLGGFVMRGWERVREEG